MEAIQNINIDDVLCLDYNDPNISIDNFYNNINYILDEFAPFKKLNKGQIKLKTKPWINKEAQHLMWERDKLFKKFRTATDDVAKNIFFNNYKKLRNELTSLKRINKLEYYKLYFGKNKKKTAAMWKGIISLVTIKSSNKTDISILDSNGELITNPLKIVNCFNEYFVNVGSMAENKIPCSNISYTHYLKQICINKSFCLRPATADEIHGIINSMDSNKSLGPNSIPIYIMKLCNDFVSSCLVKIVNLSFLTGIFPDLCKIAKVVPIFKKEDPLKCSNYRPISILPIFSKIFEKIIYTRMYAFLEENNLLQDKQFGFRSKHSTTHALISLTESIKNDLDNKEIVSGIFIDLEKAFDTVNHSILCNKLNYYGFRGKFNDLIKSYLTNRKQFVSINGYDSTKQDITCGVPQGSTLGPLLFLLYINDLKNSVKFAKASHFADDTCLTYSNKNPKTLESNLNYDLKNLTQWLRANRLSLNVDKTKLLIFKSK